jgi:hypothetical protein
VLMVIVPFSLRNATEGVPYRRTARMRHEVCSW